MASAAEPLLDPATARRLERLMLASRKLSTGRRKGERRSRRRGSSTDFADYRNYAPGDDLRFLDWKIYGRLERLFLKLFLEEENLRVGILLDTSPSMEFGTPAKLLYAKRVAAALGFVCLHRQDTLTVSAFGDGLARTYGPRSGRAHGPAYLDFLASLAPVESTSLARSFREFAQADERRGLAIVISDFYDFDGYEEAFRPLFARDFEVLALHVLSPEELRPDLQGDVRLVDAEFGATADVSLGARVLETYARTLNAFCNGLRGHVTARGGTYVLASTATPFDHLVLEVLRRRGVIR